MLTPLRCRAQDFCDGRSSYKSVLFPCRPFWKIRACPVPGFPGHFGGVCLGRTRAGIHRDPPGSTGKTVCIFLTVCVLPTIKGAVPCICIPAERIYAYTHGGDFLRTSPHVSAPTKLESKNQICQTDGVTIFFHEPKSNLNHFFSYEHAPVLPGIIPSTGLMRAGINSGPWRGFWARILALIQARILVIPR